jgi:hypothetical protein
MPRGRLHSAVFCLELLYHSSAIRLHARRIQSPTISSRQTLSSRPERPGFFLRTALRAQGRAEEGSWLAPLRHSHPSP